MVEVTAAGPLPLRDRRVLVVGASSGIGRGFAVAAASLGARVACAARSGPGVEATAAEVGEQGTAIVADVTSPDDCERIATEAVEALGGLDAVLYTPAPGLHVRLRDHDAGTWDAQLHPILVGASAITRAVLPRLTPKGVVAYLSSVATRWSAHTQFGMAGYAASKAALETMIRGWQAEEPGFRFTSVVIGSTVGVSRREQHQQDPELEAEIRRRLEGAGVLGLGYMTSDDLGRFLAETVALLLAHPGIAAPELVLEPSGRPDAGG